MTSTTNHWKLGLFVLLGMLALVGTALWLGATAINREVRASTIFLNESVQGLEVGSPVKYRGVTIGTVSEIGFAPDHQTVAVTAEVYVDVLERFGLDKARADRPEGMAAQLASAGITGNKYVLVDIFDVERRPLNVFDFPLPGNAFPSVSSDLKNLEDSALDVLEGLPLLLADGRTMLAALQRTLIDLDAPGLADDVGALMATLEAKAGAVDAAGLAASVTELATTLNEKLGPVDTADLDGQVDQLLVRGEETLAAIQAAVLEFTAEDGSLAVLVADTDRLVTTLESSVAGADLTRTGEDLRAVARELRRTLTAARSLAELIERDPGVLLRGRSLPSSPAPETR